MNHILEAGKDAVQDNLSTKSWKSRLFRIIGATVLYWQGLGFAQGLGWGEFAELVFQPEQIIAWAMLVVFAGSTGKG